MPPRKLAARGEPFDPRFEPSNGGEKGTLTLQAGLQSVSQIQPMLPGSRGQRTERADDALAGTLGGVLRLDEEKVGVGFALVSLGGFAVIQRTLYISYTTVM